MYPAAGRFGVRLPRSSISRILAYVLVAGIALGLLAYAFLRLLEPALPRSPEWVVLASLLFGLLVGLSMTLAVKLALRQAAHELHSYALDLTGTDLPALTPALTGDEIAYLHAILKQVLASVPQPEVYPQLAGDLVRIQDFDDAIQVAAQHLARHIPLTGALLLELDVERDLLLPVARYGNLYLAPNTSFDMAESAIGQALRERRTAHYNSLQVADLIPLRGTSGPLSLYSVPLYERDQPFGTLCLFSAGADLRLSDAQLAFTRTMTDILMVALQRVMYRHMFERENRRLSGFEQLGTALVTGASFDGILRQVLQAAAKITGSQHGSLLLLNADCTDVRHRVTLKEGDVLPLNVVAAPILKHGLAGWVIREKRADLIDDTELDGRWLPLPGLDTMRSALAAPLLVDGQLVGVLTLADPSLRHYSRRSLAIASILASYAASILVQLEQRRAEHPLAAPMRRLFVGRIDPRDLEELLKDEYVLDQMSTVRDHAALVIRVGVRGLERLEPTLTAEAQIKRVIEPFMTALTDAVYAFQGYVARRDEHGVTAVFGYPLAVGDDRVRGLRAALAMQAALRRLRGEWRRASGIDLVTGIGIAYGSVTMGVVGNEHYQRLVMLGSPVREAHRLQQLARVDEILAGSEVVADLQLEGLARLESLAPLTLQADSAAKLVYRVGPPDLAGSADDIKGFAHVG
jgi:class 3 adenylate cyclase